MTTDPRSPNAAMAPAEPSTTAPAEPSPAQRQAFGLPRAAPSPPRRPPFYLPALIVFTFLALCVLVVVGRVDMTQSATAALVGVVLGGLLDVIRTMVRFYFTRPEDAPLEEDPHAHPNDR